MTNSEDTEGLLTGGRGEMKALPRGPIKGLAITQIVMGCLAVAAQIVILALYHQFFNAISQGIWCGIAFIVCGIIGIVASKKATKPWIITHLVLCVAICLFSACIIALSALTAAYNYGSLYTYQPCYYHPQYYPEYAALNVPGRSAAPPPPVLGPHGSLTASPGESATVKPSTKSTTMSFAEEMLKDDYPDAWDVSTARPTMKPASRSTTGIIGDTSRDYTDHFDDDVPEAGGYIHTPNYPTYDTYPYYNTYPSYDTYNSYYYNTYPTYDTYPYYTGQYFDTHPYNTYPNTGSYWDSYYYYYSRYPCYGANVLNVPWVVQFSMSLLMCLLGLISAVLAVVAATLSCVPLCCDPLAKIQDSKQSHDWSGDSHVTAQADPLPIKVIPLDMDAGVQPMGIVSVA